MLQLSVILLALIPTACALSVPKDQGVIEIDESSLDTIYINGEEHLPGFRFEESTQLEPGEVVVSVEIDYGQTVKAHSPMEIIHDNGSYEYLTQTTSKDIVAFTMIMYFDGYVWEELTASETAFETNFFILAYKAGEWHMNSNAEAVDNPDFIWYWGIDESVIISTTQGYSPDQVWVNLDRHPDGYVMSDMSTPKTVSGETFQVFTLICICEGNAFGNEEDMAVIFQDGTIEYTSHVNTNDVVAYVSVSTIINGEFTELEPTTVHPDHVLFALAYDSRHGWRTGLHATEVVENDFIIYWGIND